MVIGTAILVDDKPENLDPLIRILDNMKIKVVGLCHTQNDVIRLIKENRPNLAFLGENMPRFKGIEAIGKIKKISPMTSIVMMTADTSKTQENFLEDLRICTVINKPIAEKNIPQVMEKIQISIEMNNKLRTQIQKRYPSLGDVRK